MASIGQELKRERELRGIPLQEIADATKINIRFLRALEKDQLDMLPEKFFTRGIIRTCAKYLGLDEENMLNLYLESLQIHEPEETEMDQDETPHKPQKKQNKFWLFFSIFMIILALFITFTFILKKEVDLSPQKKISSASLTSREVPKQEESDQDRKLEPIVNPSVIQEPVENSQGRLNLEIKVEQETWMEIYADQELQYTGNKAPGATLQLRAQQEFVINLGNAGGITYTINGQKGKRLGEPGTVIKDIQITLDNYQDFIEEK